MNIQAINFLGVNYNCRKPSFGGNFRQDPCTGEMCRVQNRDPYGSDANAKGLDVYNVYKSDETGDQCIIPVGFVPPVDPRIVAERVPADRVVPEVVDDDPYGSDANAKSLDVYSVYQSDETGD